MVSKRGRILLFAIPGIHLAFSQTAAKPPEVIRQVETVWGPELEKSYYVEPVRVGLQLDAGTPVALRAASGIPDNVVRALEKWRFRGGAGVTLTVPVRRPITPFLEQSFRQKWKPATKELDDALKSGFALTATDASALEEQVGKNAGDPISHATLLAFASRAAGDHAAKLREDQLAWLVPNRPDDDVLGSPVSLINIREDRPGYLRIGQMWVTQIKEHPENPTVQEHAIQFLKLADPETAEKLILRFIGAEKEAYGWIGDLYALQSLGVTALDPHTGLPAAAPDHLPGTALVQKIKATLDSTMDARMVLATMANLSVDGRALANAGHLPQGYAEWCEQLRARAVAFYPETSASCDTSLPLPGAERPVAQVSVGGNTQLARRVKLVQPSYPPEAKAQRVQGSIHFQTTIGADGRVKSLELLEGGLVFYESSRTAVSKWEYQPTLLNGTPVDVSTDITVNYTMQ